MYRSCHGRGGPLQSVHHNETLVLARVHAVDQPPLDGYGKVRRVFHTLYQREKPHPPVLPLGTHVKPTNVKNEIPLEADMKASVQRLRLHRAGGHTHLCVEHFKQWQRETYPGEQSKIPPRREHWVCLVDLLQHKGPTGEIPQELGWTILVLIPKGTTITQGIGLLDTLC